jgi:TfoX/Sxy family transcriptional regulator of competence genes
MAYDEGLAERLREAMEDVPGISAKKMFGGLCFLVSGHMCCGIVKDELMVRVGPDVYDECLGLPHAREMDFTGRAMKGMIYVATDGFEDDEDLEAWVGRGVAFASSLPPKSGKRSDKRSDAKTTAKAKRKPAKKAKKVSKKKASKSK